MEWARRGFDTVFQWDHGGEKQVEERGGKVRQSPERAAMDPFDEFWCEGSTETCYGARRIWDVLFVFKMGDVGICFRGTDWDGFLGPLSPLVHLPCRPDIG